MADLRIGDNVFDLRAARVEEIIDLRHAVLRQGLPREAAVFDGDAAPTARHYAALREGLAVCCATFHASEWEGAPAWQLRGMATNARFRSIGLGKAVLRLAEADLRAASPVRQLWCNARTPAARFYQSQGWAICSDLFDIPTAGPHYRMVKRLAD